MKLHALLTNSESYIVAKFQLVSAIVRQDITVLQKGSGNRATNCTYAVTNFLSTFPIPVGIGCCLL